MNGEKITLREVAEWVSLERLCCPFLTFQIEVAAGKGDGLISLRGPEGVKQVLAAELK